jgi:hypothetical protein
LSYGRHPVDLQPSPWILETWQSSLTLADFPDSCGLPGFLSFLDSSWSCGSLCLL